jgi:hypothetical protein
VIEIQSIMMIFTILGRVFKDISDEFANVNPISTVIKTKELRMNAKKISYSNANQRDILNLFGKNN